MITEFSAGGRAVKQLDKENNLTLCMCTSAQCSNRYMY